VEIAKKVYENSKQHGLNLAKTAVVFKALMMVLARLTGGPQQWHALLSGAVAGYLCWGVQNPINVQVNMYLLSRILSGLLFVLVNRYELSLPSWAFKGFAAVMWAIVMHLFTHYPGSLQLSLLSSMTYIYNESNVYSGLRDLLLVNSPQTF
jgi:peroxisomal membrane protein 4